jgi:hypothetical protein
MIQTAVNDRPWQHTLVHDSLRGAHAGHVLHSLSKKKVFLMKGTWEMCALKENISFFEGTGLQLVHVVPLKDALVPCILLTGCIVLSQHPFLLVSYPVGLTWIDLAQ